MATLKLTEACNTKYFSDDFVYIIKTVLSIKPDVVDTTGARLTPKALEALAEYYREKDESGSYVCKSIIDNRDLILKYFQSVRDLDNYSVNDYDTPILVPTSQEEYIATIKKLKDERSAGIKYHIDTQVAKNSVVAAFYILLQMVFPELAIYIPDPALAEVGNFLKSDIPREYLLENCPRDKVKVMAFGSSIMELTLSNGTYDLGVLGKKTYEELLRNYTIIPPEFGKETVDRKNGPYVALYNRCLKIMTDYFKSKKAPKSRDLYTILTEGV